MTITIIIINYISVRSPSNTENDTVGEERFARLIFKVSVPSNSQKYFCVALAISAHYLVQLKRGTYIYGKTFMAFLKNVKNVKV